MAGQSLGGPRRTRNPQLHRDAILQAAGQAFAERGYRDATLREIARRAGVTHGLVVRHFGSKEELFLAAVPGTRDLADTASGPLDTLPERIAAGYVHRMEASEGTDPFIALLRSAVVDDSAAGRLLVAMQESSIEVYGDLLGREVAESVVPLLGSMLIGVTFSRYIVRSGALAEMTTDELRGSLVRAISALLATG
jgi:AcrR family transcriptional regulator